jgi:type IV pilus assembly protein PilA
MKTLQKGFSLVELLVVVAIIGVLAGVGIVGYQGYTDSAKDRVAIANFNSVKRFAETELTLLNNNIQTTSAAILNYDGAACSSTTTANTKFDNSNADHTLGTFLQGMTCYFAVSGGYGNAFKNPYKPSASQVNFNNTETDKGTINIALITATEAAAETKGGVVLDTTDTSVAADEEGFFVVTYYKSDGTEAVSTDGDKRGKKFELK